jgi:hypothetical protein
MAYSDLTEPDAITPGWRAVCDGNAWYAIGPEFEDPVISAIGWGATPEDSLGGAWAGIWWQKRSAPERFPGSWNEHTRFQPKSRRASCASKALAMDVLC